MPESCGTKKRVLAELCSQAYQQSDGQGILALNRYDHIGVLIFDLGSVRGLADSSEDMLDLAAGNMRREVLRTHPRVLVIGH